MGISYIMRKHVTWCGSLHVLLCNIINPSLHHLSWCPGGAAHFSLTCQLLFAEAWKHVCLHNNTNIITANSQCVVNSQAQSCSYVWIMLVTSCKKKDPVIRAMVYFGIMLLQSSRGLRACDLSETIHSQRRTNGSHFWCVLRYQICASKHVSPQWGDNF